MAVTDMSRVSGDGRRSSYDLTVLFLCAYVLIGAAVSLSGWGFDMPRLADWDGDGITIQPNATVAAMASSLALLAVKFRRDRIALVLSILVTLIGLTALFQILTEIDLGINTILMFGREWGRVGVVVSGRMDTPGSISWSLIGLCLSLVAITRPRNGANRSGLRVLAVSLALTSLTVAGLSIAGYLNAAEAGYTIPRLTVLALQTATFIFAISLAILISIKNAGPMRFLYQPGSTGLMLRRLLPAAVVIPVVFTLLQLAGERSGLYDRGFGIAVATVTEVVLLILLLWITGRAAGESEARKSAMFETALDCIITIDHRGRVIEFNPAAERTFGFTREEATGRELAELIIPVSLRDAHRQGLARYLATGEGPVIDKRVELTAIRSTGEEFPVELSITRVSGLGAPYFTAYLRDITERKRSERMMVDANSILEDRVQERTAELNITNQALARSNRELEQFASIASHDLQEPLRKIQAFGDRLSTKFGDKLGLQGQDYLVRMNRSATRMRTLIDSLLTFSRVTTKAQEFVGVDLNAVARDVMSDLESLIQATRGTVEIGELPVIEADEVQLGQLLQNLIGNALKFHKPDEPPVVKVTAQTIESGDGVMCEISVSDYGIGFDEKYLDRVFEVFQRLQGRQQYEGTGVGLAICRKIAARHGGDITARSEPGVGSTFVVTLPVKHS